MVNLRVSLRKVALTVNIVVRAEEYLAADVVSLRATVARDSHAMDFDFDLLGSLRYDSNIRDAEWNSAVNAGHPSPYLLLPYVVDRFVDAAKVHGRAIPAELTLPHLRNLCDKAVYLIDNPQKVVTCSPYMSTSSIPQAWSRFV